MLQSGARSPAAHGANAFFRNLAPEAKVVRLPAVATLFQHAAVSRAAEHVKNLGVNDFGSDVIHRHPVIEGQRAVLVEDIGVNPVGCRVLRLGMTISVPLAYAKLSNSRPYQSDIELLKCPGIPSSSHCVPSKFDAHAQPLTGTSPNTALPHKTGVHGLAK